MEFYKKNNKLISENEWIHELDNIRNNDFIENKEDTKNLIKNGLFDAVKKRVENEENFGVMFSGGLDSSLIALICKKLDKKFNCYSIGFKDLEGELPKDCIYAKRVAEFLDLNLKIKLFNTKETEQLLKETASGLSKNLRTPSNVSTGTFLSAVKKCSEKDCSLLLSGLGSEEIFAGYKRYKKRLNQQERCWADLKKIYERRLLVHHEISKKHNLVFSTPFLDKNIIKLAMQTPMEYKISSRDDKIILREIAEESGLEHFSYTKKRSFSNGSNFDIAIMKLAKLNKFNNKKDYLSRICRCQ